VLLAASDVDPSPGLAAGWRQAAARAVRWMIQVQHADGGFGAAEGIPASIEETSLAVEALARWAKASGPTPAVDSALRLALIRGVTFLADRTQDGTTFTPSPIGLYFARLWYWERLYPIVFTVGALEQARGVLGRPPVQATRSGATPP
jgi:squalene-hopene/tetraprenyl-beta-curcumene cyclase